jgi:hypothetical protein
MDVASRWRLGVGVVRWGAPQPTLTVVVKATFRLDGPRPGTLHEPPEPLFEDDAGDVGTAEELEHASDFAPRKARPEVLLVGHAHASEPKLELHAALEVDGLHKSFRAAAGAPSTAIPLLAEYLMRDEDDTPLRVAPSPVHLHAWRGRVLSGGFDFGAFNAAPPDQQLEVLGTRARVVLRGLLASAAEREIRLPGLEPAVFLMRSRDRLDAAEPVPLTCDTLWIHADREICTLSWRGAVPAPAAGAYLVVDAAYGRAPDWAQVVPELGSVRWSKAAEATDHAAPQSAATVPSIRLADDETTNTLPGPLVDELPTEVLKGPDNPMAKIAAAAAVELEPDELESLDEKAPDTPRLGVVLGRGGASPLGGIVLGAPKATTALPFDGSAPAARPAPTSSAPAPQKRLGEDTVAIDDAQALIRSATKSALPFRRDSSPGMPAEPPAPRRQSGTAPIQGPAAASAPTPPAFDVPPHLAAAGRIGASTVTSEVERPNAPPLPFGGSRPPPPPIAAEDLPRLGGETATRPGDETLIGRSWSVEPALPFRASGAAAHIPPPRAAAPVPPPFLAAGPAVPAGHASAPPPIARPPLAPLPASPSPLAPPPLAPVAPPPPLAPAVPPKPVPEPPRTAAAAPPPEPKPSDKGELLPLDTYAAVKVALLRGKALPAVLEKHGLDEMSWRLEERRRAEALSRAAERGDLSVVHTLRKAMRDAQKKADESG